MAPKLGSMRNAENGLCSQPDGHIGPVEAGSQLARAQILFRLDLVANIARLRSIRNRHRLIQDSNRGFRGGWGVLSCGKTPCVEIAETAGLQFPNGFGAGRPETP